MSIPGYRDWRNAQAFYETSMQLISRRAAARHARAAASLLASPCILLSFLSVSPVWAVDPNRHISQYAHYSWSIQDGHLPGAASALAQTGDGYLWIGTSAGLVRFDGIRFVAWHAPGEPLSFATSEITALLAARDGTLWIAARTSPVRQILSHWTGRQLVNIPVESTGIWSIAESRSGAVWIPRPFCQVMGVDVKCHTRPDGTPFEHGDSIAEDAEIGRAHV